MVTSEADRGAPTKSTILPIILPIKIDEEEWANDWEINCIAIKPGAKKFINSTPSTCPLSSPIANELFGMKDVFAEILGGTVFLEHKGGLSLTHYGAIGN